MRTIFAAVIAICFTSSSWAFEALNEGEYVCFFKRGISIDVFGFNVIKEESPMQLKVSKNTLTWVDIPVTFNLRETDRFGSEGDYSYYNEMLNTDLQFAVTDGGALLLLTEFNPVLGYRFLAGECVKN